MKTISLELKEGKDTPFSPYVVDGESIICRDRVHEYFDVPDDYEKIWLTLSTEVLEGGYETYVPPRCYAARYVVLSDYSIRGPYGVYDKLDRTINKLEGLDDKETVWLRIEYI